MSLKRRDWAIDRNQFSNVEDYLDGSWTPYNPHTIVQKGAIALSMQWYKSNDSDALTRHLSEAGGSEMMAHWFAVGMLNQLDGAMSRVDLNQLALAFILELERRNQETPNPRACTDLASAVSRIQRQFNRTQSDTMDAPKWGDPLRLVDPRYNPHIDIEIGERFQVNLPINVANGYGWWDVDVDPKEISIVSRQQRDHHSSGDRLERIDTIFTMQGIERGSSRLKFCLQSYTPQLNTKDELWLTVNVVAHGSMKNGH